jgi:hypothetical protein
MEPNHFHLQMVKWMGFCLQEFGTIMPKQLKYQWLIDREKLHGCPFEHCTERTIEAFRWVYADIKDSRNFMPKLLLDEQSKAPRRMNSDADDFKCSCCGLSMFVSLDAARTKYQGFTSRTKKLLGYTHIASGIVNPEVGLSGKANQHGHFDLFEYESIELDNVFEIKEII